MEYNLTYQRSREVLCFIKRRAGKRRYTLHRAITEVYVDTYLLKLVINEVLREANAAAGI